MYTNFNNSFTVVFSDLMLRKVVYNDHLTLSLLPHYLAKLERATVQLYKKVTKLIMTQ